MGYRSTWQEDEAARLAEAADEARGIWLNGWPLSDCQTTSGEVEYPDCTAKGRGYRVVNTTHSVHSRRRQSGW